VQKRCERGAKELRKQWKEMQRDAEEINEGGVREMWYRCRKSTKKVHKNWKRCRKSTREVRKKC